MSPGSPDEKDTERESWFVTRRGRAARYVAVFVVLVAAIVLSHWDRFAVCTVVDSAKDGLTTTCAPPDLTQASVLAVVALVIALLWPDIQEFTAFGVTIKKLVKDVGDRVRRVGETTGRVDATANRIEATTSATQGGVTAIQATLEYQAGRLTEILSTVRDQRVGPRNRYGSQEGTVDRAERAAWRIAGLLVLAFESDRERLAHSRESVLSNVQVDVGGEMPFAEDPLRMILVGELFELWRRLGGPAGERVQQWQPEQPGLDGRFVAESLRALADLIAALASGIAVERDWIVDAVLLARVLVGYRR